MTMVARHALRVILPVSLLLGLVLSGPAAFAQQRVGVDAAVNPAAMGTPPGGAVRQLVVGQDVVFNERIATTAAGQAQILFVDESSLSVGPNANMVIDRFVYDPHTGTGQLAASLTRGVFRFVGGKLSKHDNAVTMYTPTATIGIRGGVMLVQVGAECAASAVSSAGCPALRVIFVYGDGVTITGSDGTSQTITRPGFEVTVARPGAAPSAPGPAPAATTAELLTQLDGRPGGHGGAPIIPTEVTVATSGIANAISADVAASVRAASLTQPPPVEPQSVGTAVQLTQLNNQNASVPAATATPIAGGRSLSIAQFPVLPPGTPIGSPTAVRPFVPIPVVPVVMPPAAPSAPVVPQPPHPPPINPPGPPPVDIAHLAGGYYSTGDQGVAFGFKQPAAPYADGRVANGVFSAIGANGGFGAVSFPLAQGSAALPASGAGTTSPLGPVTGVTYLSPDHSFFFAELVPVHEPAQREFIYGGEPVENTFTAARGPRVLAFAIVPDAALRSLIPFIRRQEGGALPDASISPLILATPAGSVFSTETGATKALQASLAITGTGAAQKSAIVVLVGNVFGNPPVLEGVVHGSYLASATSQPVAINTYYATPTDGAGNSLYGRSTLSGFVLSPGAGAASAVATDTLNQQTTARYQFAQPAIPVAAPAVATASPSAQTLTGWFGGIMTREPASSAGRPIPYMLTGRATITTHPGDLQITATLAGGDPATSHRSGIPAANGMVLQFGSTAGTNARQAYVNNNLFAIEESPVSDSRVDGVSVPINLQFPQTNPNLYLVTQTAAPPTSLLPDGLCACRYLQWGYWGGELDTPAFGDEPARVDVGHINSWVAGIPTSVGDISSLKAANFTGSYTGNLFGTVINGTAQYLASGRLAASYNFGSGAGAFSVIDYDGLSFTARGRAALSGANYTFGLAAPGIAGAVSGSFYGPMAAETGGNFAFAKTAGPAYFTSGIFAARR
ncbi:MAG TPA: FecR family protein [Stellaceae bacterium]|nr:FecR family protein [Stellaceae bacterium]